MWKFDDTHQMWSITKKSGFIELTFELGSLCDVAVLWI